MELHILDCLRGFNLIKRKNRSFESTSEVLFGSPEANRQVLADQQVCHSSTSPKDNIHSDLDNDGKPRKLRTLNSQFIGSKP